MFCFTLIVAHSVLIIYRIYQSHVFRGFKRRLANYWRFLSNMDLDLLNISVSFFFPSSTSWTFNKRSNFHLDSLIFCRNKHGSVSLSNQKYHLIWKILYLKSFNYPCLITSFSKREACIHQFALQHCPNWLIHLL